jgi:hypothetical protein
MCAKLHIVYLIRVSPFLIALLLLVGGLGSSSAPCLQFNSLTMSFWPDEDDGSRVDPSWVRATVTNCTNGQYELDIAWDIVIFSATVSTYEILLLLDRYRQSPGCHDFLHPYEMSSRLLQRRIGFRANRWAWSDCQPSTLPMPAPHK